MCIVMFVHVVVASATNIVDIICIICIPAISVINMPTITSTIILTIKVQEGAPQFWSAGRVD